MGTFQKKKWEKKCGARDNPWEWEWEWGLSRGRNGKRNLVEEIIQGKGRGECHITETEKNDYFFWDGLLLHPLELRQC